MQPHDQWQLSSSQQIEGLLFAPLFQCCGSGCKLDALFDSSASFFGDWIQVTNSTIMVTARSVCKPCGKIVRADNLTAPIKEFCATKTHNSA